MGRAVVRGATWATSARMLTQALQFAVGLVLARLLVPEEFGLVASVYVITGFAVMFFELGLGSALVQRASLTEKDKSTVFWVNALGGVLFAGLLALAAPLVADFYGQPELVALTPLVALAFTLSIGVVHNALLQRRLAFRAVATIEVVAAVLGHGTTLVAALLGAGAYALAYGPLVTSAAASIGSFAAVRWWPRHFISGRSLRELWRFSGGLLGFNVVNYWGRNADSLLVGRVLGAAPLGLYNRAYNLMLLPITQVTAALGRVMFSALSAMQGDHARMRSAYLRSLRVINTVTVPMLVGLAAVSDGLVPLLWGPNWTATIPVLQVLCIAGLPQCISTSVGWLYQATGRTTVMFLMGVVGTVVGVVAIVVGLQWGVVGVAVAVLVRYWLMLPVGVHVAGRAVGLRARTVLAQAAPVFFMSLVMGGVVRWGPDLLALERTSPLVVVGQVLVGGALYVALLALFARPSLSEVLAVARRKS
ncbi:lipopolysaccharide biosynthesis protein [Pseudokineococcus marinus]|uniref:Lipopolysaccharide biosynthesis protein n=2 Tax=Pseudokineococcus marinus TaxID=351215 RepID=A0A849BFP4_9ACTN|nr:lipopolysaccharide biosynthesis protein [Pseudokineococcus marinus]